MALFYQHNINEHTRLAVWRIEEEEQFFLEKVPLKQDVTHPYKRLQHLAGRYLLPVLYPDFPLKDIQVADTKKPFLEDEKYHFSISHCGNFAAAIASSQKRVGVDIELITPRILRIAPKFLNAEEIQFLAGWKDLPEIYRELCTMIWSAKEAIFKWHGAGQVDFRRHMQLQLPVVYQPDEWMVLTFQFLKDPSTRLEVHTRQFEGIVLGYVVS